MFGIGFTELIVILVIALVILGPERLPEVAKSIGKMVREYKKATNDIKKSVEDIDIKETKSQPPAPSPEDKGSPQQLAQGGTPGDV